MNGSKNILIVIIFLMALLPWGFLVALLNSENGAELLGIEVSGTSPDAVEEMQDLIESQRGEIESQREEIEGLTEALTAARDGEEPLITPAKLAELQDSLEAQRAENREARAELERLRTEYNSALSEVVRLKTQQMAAEAAPKPEAAPAAPEPAQNTRPAPNPGGWILPPSN